MSSAISVIVPVYNAESYLQECADSLLQQTFRDVEFIFVDDGSTDRSVEFLEEYRQKDDRIQILRQQNQYAGVARNNGMKAATGKYIIFLDADDFFEPTMLEEAYNCAEENQAQIVVFNYYRFDHAENRSVPHYELRMPSGVFSSESFEGPFFTDYYGAPWNKLYLKSFVDKTGLSFQAVRKSNDTFFVLITACLADRIIYLPKRLVYYRVNNPSSLQGNISRGREAFLYALSASKEELKRRCLFTDTVCAAFSDYASHLIDYYSQLGERTLEGQRAFYELVKARLIPDLYDAPENFQNDPLIKSLYESNSFEEFLFLRLEWNKNAVSQLYQKIREIYEHTVSVNSKDYKIGHAVLALPRAIFRGGKKRETGSRQS